MGPLMLLGFAAYSARGILPGFGDDEPKELTPDEAMKGLFVGQNVLAPAKFGITKLAIGLGALVAGAMNGDWSPKQAAIAYANALVRESPAGVSGVQYVPTTEHAHWLTMMLAQVLGAGVAGKPVQYAANVNAFGRPIHKEGGKLTTPDFFKEGPVLDFDPEAAPFVLKQLGYAGDILDYAARLHSKNQTDADLRKARGVLTGLDAVTVGGTAGQITRQESAESELTGDYAYRLRRARAIGPDAVKSLRASEPNGRSVEAYLRLDARLCRQYSNARKSWAGRPDFSERIAALERQQNALREKMRERLRAGK